MVRTAPSGLRWGVAAVLAGALGVLAIAPMSGAVVANGRPSLTVLHHWIVAAIRLGHDPTNLSSAIPDVAAASGAVPLGVKAKCYGDAATTSGAATHCTFGDRKVHRTILLTGDAHADMWLPALSEIGTDLHWKIVFVGRPHCSPWADGAPSNVGGCRAYEKSVVALDHSLKAAVVIPVGAKVSWKHSISQSATTLESEMSTMVKALRGAGSKVVLFSMAPEYNKGFATFTPRSCLTHKARYLRPCERAAYLDMTDSVAAVSTVFAAHELHAPLVDTSALFCSGTLCSLFVETKSGARLVYADAHQINRYYSVLVSLALEGMLKPKL
jgi:hypothetical protein